MSLQFILGNSGSGKSQTLYQWVIEESRRHPERNYIIIVPEQFTMQTQKDLVMLHPDRGIMNIDVLSFGRLAHRIFEEVGADRRSVLTETGKNLMIRKVAIEQKDALLVLGGRMNRTGYVSQVKSVLSELMQYEITDAMLEEMQAFVKERPLLYAKLADLRVLYAAFLDYQRDRYMKPEELLDVLCHVAPRSALLKNSTLAFDGFAGFTPAQLNVLEELLVLCPKVLITVTIDARESFYGQVQEHELFAKSKKLIGAVTEVAKRASLRRERAGQSRKAQECRARSAEQEQKAQQYRARSAEQKQKAQECQQPTEQRGAGADADGAFIEEPLVLGRKSRPRFARGGALDHLEQNLFRTKRTEYREKPEEISLHTAVSPSEEVHFAARTICRLVREQGYRYHEIAVITGNLAAYDNYVKKIFPVYEVPAFLDETRHILLNPCLEFVRGALLAAEQDFSAESVFRVLRTGMLSLSAQETDRLENYVLAAGIRGRRMWERKWEYLPGFLKQEELEAINEYRARVAEQLGPFAEKMRQKNAVLQSYADALCDLLEQCGVQQKLKDRENALLAAGAREEAREYGQIYAILIGLLDEMVDLLGEEQVSGKEFGEILDAGVSEARVGIVPPGIDQVQVGDIERSRLAHVKVLFFLGLNDGWVPAHGDGGGIVSDMERELLQKTGIELAPSARENSYIQRFYLYQNLTKPQDHLYLSWCRGSGDGTAMRPSYLVAALQRLFPGLAVTQEQEAGVCLEQITSQENGMLYLTRAMERIREEEPSHEWLELYRTYLREEPYRERVRTLVRAAFAHGEDRRLSQETARGLYGEVMTNSVTRLEQFAACAFAHFAAYGLQLGERQRYGVRAVDLGILFHQALELFARKLEGRQLDWTTVTDEERSVLIEQCVDEVSQEYGAGVLQKTARDGYTVRRLKRILERTVWALQEQLRAGSFRPVGYEVSFADAGSLKAAWVSLGSGGRMRLLGRIDRIDTAQDEEAVYVKVVDYKSGMTAFDPVSLYYGLQLQLLVYLSAALEMEQKLHKGKRVVPAGIFYYRMQDPLLEKEAEVTAEEQLERLLKKLRPDGLLNADPEILRLLDRGLEGDSLVIPAGLKKDGSLKAASSAVSAEQFDQLLTFVSEKLRQMGAQMMDGEIGARPFADKNGSACDYCIYSDVCGYDRKIPDLCRKREPEVGKEEVWERIARECRETVDASGKVRRSAGITDVSGAGGTADRSETAGETNESKAGAGYDAGKTEGGNEGWQ